MPRIKDSLDQWKEDRERLILYADIMGFKDTVMSSSHEDLKGRLENFKKNFDRKIEPLKSGSHLKYVQFSDSVIIVVNGINTKMVNLITKAATILMHQAVKMKFPIKGVISKGVFTFDERSELYFGRPLVDAALLHDEIYYYGIVVHHSAEHDIKKYISADIPFLCSPVALKKGKTSHYHLAWGLTATDLSPKDITEDVMEWLTVIQEQVSGSPRIYIDNTKEIINEDRKNKGMLNREEKNKSNIGYLVTEE
jgi:hypothetical protein